MKTIIVFALITIISLAAHAEVIDGIAAVVNGEVITRSDVNDTVAAKPKTSRGEALDGLVDDLLFDHALTEAKIDVTDDDLARAIQNVLAQNRISLEALKSELMGKGITYEQYKKQIEREIRRVKFINQVIGPQVKINEQDMRDYYQRHPEQFRAAREAHIAEMVLPFPEQADQAQFEAFFEKAHKIAREAQSNTQAFHGVDRGMVNLKELSPDVAMAIPRLTIGEVSSPILTEKAVVIIKLIALPVLTADDFEKLRDHIYNTLYDQRVEEALKNYLQQQREKAFIDIR
ncbi:MAG: peptidyl-prolyl cis-trans isomerase [Deltaproteobacteria bacterium]|nr:peptidyl-prolyl cis-trans isomerase [Deltaproteobacteria bacterium]